MGFSREEFIADDASDDAIIKTAYLLAKLIADHETMEAFLVDGLRVFNPHRSIDAHQRGEKHDYVPKGKGQESGLPAFQRKAQTS